VSKKSLGGKKAVEINEFVDTSNILTDRMTTILKYIKFNFEAVHYPHM